MVEQIEVVLKYIGGGTFIIGIPARDLTAAEVKEHGGIVELCKTGLYERIGAGGRGPGVGKSAVSSLTPVTRPLTPDKKDGE